MRPHYHLADVHAQARPGRYALFIFNLSSQEFSSAKTKVSRTTGQRPVQAALYVLLHRFTFGEPRGMEGGS